MNIKSGLKAVVVAACATLGMSAQAASSLGDPIPSSVIVSAGGLEWVWAGPCAPLSPSCGVAVLRDGFGIASDAQWTSSFADLGAIQTAFTLPGGAARCASPWFNTVWDHCDMGDLGIGAISGLPASYGGSYTTDPNAEAFLVRGVPEPSEYALMLVGLAAVGFVARRRKSS